MEDVWRFLAQSPPKSWIHCQLSLYVNSWTSCFRSTTPCVMSSCSTACFPIHKRRPSSYRSSKSMTLIPTTSGTIARNLTWPSFPRSSKELLPRSWQDIFRRTNCFQIISLPTDRDIPQKPLFWWSSLTSCMDAADSAQVTLLHGTVWSERGLRHCWTRHPANKASSVVRCHEICIGLDRLSHPASKSIGQLPRSKFHTDRAAILLMLADGCWCWRGNLTGSARYGRPQYSRQPAGDLVWILRIRSVLAWITSLKTPSTSRL